MYTKSENRKTLFKLQKMLFKDLDFNPFNKKKNLNFEAHYICFQKWSLKARKAMTKNQD